LNFGGNVGLHGKMDTLIEGFYNAKEDARASQTMKGVGITPEGIENNPMMYELLYELPWRAERFTRNEWLDEYVQARYGVVDETLKQAWKLLGSGIYNSPKEKAQQGTHESLFCARPGLDVWKASAWAESKDYYNPKEVMEAARLMLSVADKFKGNNNFEYDLVDIIRQALAEKGRLTLKVVSAAYKAEDKELFKQSSNRFLSLILLQDELLGTRKEFRVGNWTDMARNIGNSQAEKDLYEWNARVQITTWGNRSASEQGNLHDYAHKEWNGLLKDFYYMRWKTYFDALTGTLNGKEMPTVDWYAMEESWTKLSDTDHSLPEGDCIEVAKRVYTAVWP